MKKNLLLLLMMLMLSVSGYSQTVQQKKVKATASVTSKKIAMHTAKPDKKTKALRKQHAQFLANSPYKKILKLSGKERKSMGLPPNKYFESEWELTMNPATGRPTPEKVRLLRDRLNAERQVELASGRTPGDASDNSWVERGPTNVGGRTRAIMFDPNDPTYETVFAGGVSGGMWKNTNISNAASAWTRVNIQDNLNVSCIAVDPVTPTTFYVGTGESYTGDVNGDGVWKSVNAGATWTKVLGGVTGPTTFQSAANVTINTPAGIAGNYPCFPTTGFGSAVSTPITQDIVLVIDNAAPSSDGCDVIQNTAALAGKIALIRRGSCPFVQKVKAAQDAGAVGVIMMNNAPGVPVAMGGTDATITIPSTMISQSDGNLIEAALGSGTVNGALNPSTPGAITGNLVPGIQMINDLAVRNNGGVSEIFVAAGDGYAGGAYLGTYTYGVYKSNDGGANWTLLTLPLTASSNKHCPNDIEIGADNKVWVSTTESTAYGDGGGKVFASTDGTNFIDKYTVTKGTRTQIAVSKTVADKVYVLSEITPVAPATIEVTIIKTTDGFASSAATSLPVGNETRETTYGFTGQQAFYDLMIEVDPSNDQVVYVGGIDLYRSADAGANWTAISNWTSDVHSDQHTMTFKPNNSNIGLFGNDGGVYYSASLSGGTPATSRNKGFNVTQFYSLGVAPSGATGGNLVNDYYAAGAQDNGSQYFASAAAGANSSVEVQGGDGAFTMFDQGADKYYITNYVYNNNINRRTTAGAVKSINSETTSNGAFIAPMVLDSNLNILYSDYTTAAGVYQIRRYTNVGLTGTVAKALLTNALLTNSPTAFAVSPYTTATTTLLVGCRNGKLLRITGAQVTVPGPIWTDITGPGFVGSISDVEFGATNNDIFVTFHNYNVTSIWYSADAGVTWQNKEGNFPDIPVKCILQNPLNLNEVIVGSELGVWYTNTFSSATPVWNQSYNGMSNVKVTDMDLRNDNSVFAATYGRGIFSGIFTGTTLSTDDLASSVGVKVYPNPTSDVLNISVAGYSGKMSVKLFDLNGKEVYSKDYADFVAEKAISLNGLQSGIYILKMKGQDLSHTSKVVLN
ncbi:PA domain-containing protein [Flavobacterium sp. GT3R68]|uniref:PA domain-containing protein n=1 Tax=Flavobacterium sp. GT3R68 TaxID=2594437 RepID=UPI000F87C9D9|nr:PA domain-containing protein [Flavobacterium sp. GT3R68]RTY93963.1 T9SS type A sorting domain-containing protein [Flavobacterium sp. GSN2]TRW93423.1 T9SS type A sorting domain-containing protein [Flavobacterium sp. GT3R68]